MVELTDAIATLHRIGTSTEPKLNRLGIRTVSDLIWYLPSRYEDLSKISKIGSIIPDTLTTIKGTVLSVASHRSFRKRLQIAKVTVEDETGTAHITWFGQRFIDKAIKEGDQIYVSGMPKRELTGVQFTNPVFEKVKEEQLHTAHIIPSYRLTSGISQKQLRFLIQTAFSQIPPFEEELPPSIIEKENFIDINTALRQVHYPDNQEMLERSIERLKFEELFWSQLKAGYAKKLYSQNEAPKINFKKNSVVDFVRSLPFVLTGDQKKTAWQILKDMESGKPMNRLVQGDVGSGKTVVAAISILNTILNGFQAVLMAPTELLALQHYTEIQRLFSHTSSQVHPALLTAKSALFGDKKTTKKNIYELLKNHTIDCIVGTHSLIQETVSLNKLGLAVVDEQHRFGVKQRKRMTELSQHPRAPHLLSLTATPIPRSLALTLYGDLDISTIREKPKGRLPIITKYIDEKDRNSVYSFIRTCITNGQQIFILCPLIEESDISESKSVMSEHSRLQEDIFPDIDVRYIHGKLRNDIKQKTLKEFKDNKFPILVTTSVIEVGIDIPNATVMLIEGAERFGLAQLHQFRGRVGRNDLQSHCFLFSQHEGVNTKERLMLMTKYDDGFLLAEKDLAIRGEGDVFGTLQSGIMNFSIATIHDSELIKRSRQWVDHILSDKDHGLWNDAMRKKLDTAETIHWE